MSPAGSKEVGSCAQQYPLCGLCLHQQGTHCYRWTGSTSGDQEQWNALRPAAQSRCVLNRGTGPACGPLL
jgi:hypothetical protein